MQRANVKAFSLTELLISIGLLALVAVFTIPTLLQSQQDAKFRSLGKDAARMLNSAFLKYRYDTTVYEWTMAENLTPYLNYVKIVTTGNIDAMYNDSTHSCGSPNMCLLLHSGGMLRIPSNAMGGVGSTNAIWFNFDPDGKVSSSPVSNTGPGKNIEFWLYADGKLLTRDTVRANTCSGAGSTYCVQPQTANTSDPPWFSFD